MTPLRSTLLAALAAALASAPTALAATPPNTTFEDAYFSSGDGTMLHADVIRPKNAPGKTPVILAIGPYFAHTGQTTVAGDDFNPAAQGPNERFKDLWDEGRIFERGYTMVQVDLRGFGASEGCNDFGGTGEQADVKAAVEWAASQPWSTGKVGMWGKSYDGWTQVMALATKPKGLAATVIQAPIIDGYRTLYQNGVHYDAGWYATPGLYQAIDASPPSAFDTPQYQAGAVKGNDPACYSQNIAEQNATQDRDNQFWESRNLVPRAAGSEVPTLWSHGLIDANTKPDNFMDVWSQLKGPHRAWFGQYTHVRPQDKRDDDPKASTTGREGFIDEAMRWMDRYVKGVPADQARVEDDPAVEVEDGGKQRYRAEAAWPPADAAKRDLELKPGTHTDQPGNDGRNGPGNGIWTTTKPLPHDIHLAGVPRVTLDVESSAPRVNIYGILYDIDTNRRAKLITRGAFAVKESGKIAFDLYPQDWTLREGHRLGFLVANSDDEWYQPPPSNQDVVVKGGTLSAPFLRFQRTAFLKSQPSEDEQALPPGFQVDVETLKEGESAFDLPPALTLPSSTALPGTNAGGPNARNRALRLSVGLRKGKGRRIKVRGRATSGSRVLVRLQRNKKTVLAKRVTAKRGRFKATFKPRRKGRYRAIASMRAAGVTVRVGSRTIRRGRR